MMTKASRRFSVPEARRGPSYRGLFRKAPPPFVAQYIDSPMGSYVTDTTGSRSTQKAMRTQVQGHRWTKLVVPSTGSIVHVGDGVSSYREEPLSSSPMIRCVGYFALISPTISFSAASSVAVSKSAPLLFVVFTTARPTPLPQARRISSPAPRAASFATASTSSSISGSCPTAASAQPLPSLRSQVGRLSRRT
jgi:hypothetical protein